MGKRRNTAKTGDRALYKAASATLSASANPASRRSSSNHTDAARNDDEVDRFHRDNEEENEFLRLDQADGDESSEGAEFEREETVMDLAAGGESSGDSSDSEDDDDGARADKPAAAGRRSGGLQRKREDDDGGSSSDDEIMDDAGNDDDDDDDGGVRNNWGRTKASYYHGDTADLEIGQDEQDAYLEEEAADEIQQSRFAQMSEDDFVLSDGEQEQDARGLGGEDGGTGGGVGVGGSSSSSAAAVARLSTRDKRRLLDAQHPELLPLLSHFSDVVGDLSTKTSVATTALFFGNGGDGDGDDGGGAAEQVGATTLGQQYLVSKELLQASTALNLAVYLLLKSDHSAARADDTTPITTITSAVDPALIQSHPVITRLQKLNELGKKLEERVENKLGLQNQVDNLVKAAALMNEEEEDDDEEEEHHGATSDGDASDSDGEEKEEENSDDEERSPGTEGNNNNTSVAKEAPKRLDVLNEARFGLRPNEIDGTSSGAGSEERKRRQRRLRAGASDSGDIAVDDSIATTTTTATMSRALASTLNSIEQRSTAVRQRRSAPLPDNIDEIDDDGDDFRPEDTDMMDAAELGVTGRPPTGKTKKSDPLFEGGGDEEEDDAFYNSVSEKSKSRKEARKDMYRVAPKFPRAEAEVEGERAVSRTIMKNRGLVAHKNKLNRNPRVKKREQYRKALIRRKGAVREVRVEEGHKYGGETTGVRSGLSKSRKL